MGIFNSNNKTENNNDLKIILYPKNKPRYNFEKNKLEKLISKGTLGYSFDKNTELAYIFSKTPILNGFYKAHSNHYPIRIKPDDIWLLIVQAFSNHVNANSERLRGLFVNFDGKKTLKVETSLSDISQITKIDLEDFSVQINKQMKEFLGEELLDILTPNYTTTDYNSSIVAKISIMGAFKKYFNYEMDLCGCGVPYIILEGTQEDYEKIMSKAEKLKKYNFEWYIDRIIEPISKMVEAKKNNIDVEYFKNFVQNKIETEYVSGLSGLGGHDVKVDYIAGWILNFFAYYSEVDGDSDSKEVERFCETSLKVEDFEKLANQMLTVPFRIVDVINNKDYMMKYKVGFIGCGQNKKKEVFPVMGWIVSPGGSEDFNSIL